jgi:Radical SAM superfamily
MRAEATVLQLNIGLYCNQACSHCHVESSPKRTEMMTRNIADRCLHLLRNSPAVKVLDITGGAPELNSEFRHLVEQASALDVEIIDRCNLTVLLEPGQEGLPEFLARHKVQRTRKLKRCILTRKCQICKMSSVCNTAAHTSQSQHVCSSQVLLM